MWYGHFRKKTVNFISSYVAKSTGKIYFWIYHLKLIQHDILIYAVEKRNLESLVSRWGYLIFALFDLQPFCSFMYFYKFFPSQCMFLLAVFAFLNAKSRYLFTESAYKHANCTQRTIKNQWIYLITEVTKMCFVVHMYDLGRFSRELGLTSDGTVVDNTKACQLSYVIQPCCCSTKIPQILTVAKPSILIVV